MGPYKLLKQNILDAVTQHKDLGHSLAELQVCTHSVTNLENKNNHYTKVSLIHTTTTTKPFSPKQVGVG
jgi:hypothetical protein